MIFTRRALGVVLTICLLIAYMPGVAASEEMNALFEAALAGLKPPAQVALETGEVAMHPGETAYVPPVAPEITPYDEGENTLYPPVSGTFESSEESVISVDDKGLMTALSEGEATVTYHAPEGAVSFHVIVSEDTPTEIAKNMAYVALREYYQVKKARLPKYNQYAKWYYGKKNEVGWCSVFGIWCANAAGSNPIKKKEAAEIQDSETLYLREGQVGNQYDGFFALDRFGSIPRPGYMVIYADMSNAYRTTHIGVVVGVEDMGDGVYQVTTVEGNMSSSVKAYRYVYDSKLANNLVGTDKSIKLQWNMSQVEESAQTDPLFQYELHTDYWSVFGFCETWK